MRKKIGSFMVIMLGICAVLLLTATANRSQTQPETTQPTAQTTVPETTSPETIPETGAAPTETQPADAVRGQVA